jgi:hypothetical protein
MTESMRALAAIGAVLSTLFQASLTPARATDDLTATVLQYGVVKDEIVGEKTAPQSPSGTTGMVGKYEFINKTTAIDACPGTTFGVEHLLNRSMRSDDKPLFLRFNYPKQVTPDGRVFTTHDMPLENGKALVYTGFTFEYKWEMVSGDWTFTLMQGDRKLTTTTFKINVGPCMVS